MVFILKWSPGVLFLWENKLTGNKEIMASDFSVCLFCLITVSVVHMLLNSLRPSDAYMRQ